MSEISIEGPAEADARKKRKLAWIAGFAFGGGAVGYVLGYALAKVAPGSLESAGPSPVVAAVIAVMYIITALTVLGGLANPNLGAKFLNVEDAEELVELRRVLVASGIGMIAYGTVLGSVVLAGPFGLIPPEVGLVIAAIALLVGIAATRRTAQLSDELTRAVSREASELTYYLLVLVGGSWAALAALGYAAPPAPLDILSMLWGLLLVATSWVAARRGMLKLR